MLQDIYPSRLDNQYRQVEPSADSTAMVVSGEKVLLYVAEGRICYPRFSDLEKYDEDLYKKAVYLFAVDGRSYFLVRGLENVKCLPFAMESANVFRKNGPSAEAFAGITAVQLARWYENNRFCGRCAHEMEEDARERMLCCPSCGHMVYPRINPAVIVAITDGERILLSKYANRGYTRYALVAGYTEVGETIEETVHREVMEEVGLKVKNLRYYKSQPWSFSDSVLMGFYCDLDGSDEITLDENELSAAGWFNRDEIPVAFTNDSLTNEMIIKFKNNEI